ncbi:MAG: Gfo/Idh/MocA family oxidoreductase [Alphaproteobacteria bacterium]
MNKVRVGFIGAGRISGLHAAEYLANPRAEIVAVCDADRGIARRQAALWGVPDSRVFDSWDALLAVDEVDAVEILLPHHLHMPATLAALAAGKHTSVQKPMAHSVADADAMCAAADRAGVAFKVFENFVFYPPVMKAKALIDDGAIGKPLSIRIKSNPGIGRNAWTVPASASAWRFARETCGGGPLVFDDGHHKFALGWHFMGQAEAVHAWIGTTEVERGLLDAPAMISWRFSEGRFGNLEAVYSPRLEIDTATYPQDDRVEITGEEGVIWITRGHGKIGDQPPVILYRRGETTGFSDLESHWDRASSTPPGTGSGR